MFTIKSRPLTGCLSTFGLTVISIANIVFFICFLNAKINDPIYHVLYSFFIGLSAIPYFILSILETEISVTTFFMFVLILCITLTYLVLPIIALQKSSKNLNGILIFLLSVDILICFPLLLAITPIGVINIVIKILLVFLCAKNIKWYNENYEDL